MMVRDFVVSDVRGVNEAVDAEDAGWLPADGFATDCAGPALFAEACAGAAFWQFGSIFFSAPRVSFVYFISPFAPTVSGWPTRHDELSEVSRILQLST